MITQGLGFASHDDVKEVCLAVHPCFRTYCDCVVVCQRGGTFAGPVRGVDFLGTGTCTFAGTSTPKASMMQRMKREQDCLFNSAYDPFNDWGGGRGCNKFVLVLRGNGTKIAPIEDVFDEPSGQMR